MIGSALLGILLLVLLVGGPIATVVLLIKRSRDWADLQRASDELARIIMVDPASAFHFEISRECDSIDYYAHMQMQILPRVGFSFEKPGWLRGFKEINSGDPTFDQRVTLRGLSEVEPINLSTFLCETVVRASILHLLDSGFSIVAVNSRFGFQATCTLTHSNLQPEFAKNAITTLSILADHYLKAHGLHRNDK